MVIGGQALLAYGEPRLTKDIDITLGIGVEELGRVKDVVKELGFSILVKDEDEFVKRTMVLPVKDSRSGIPVDLIFSLSPYERQAIGRARTVMIGRASVQFASLEDIVIHKIIAARPRDLEDVKSILTKNPVYDEAYILKWLRDFDEALGGSYCAIFDGIKKSIKP